LKKTLNWLDLGLIDYHDAFKIQESIIEAIRNGRMNETLLFQENTPIITLGRGSHPENLLKSPESLKKMGIKITQVSRGGDISYHGPGQLVVSPILYLENHVKGAHQYVRLLEQIMINLLSRFELTGFRIKGKSGVWIYDPSSNAEKKIAALGIAVAHGIAFHGISINLNPDLNHFKTIIPCGIEDRDVTSFKNAGVFVPDIKILRDVFIEEFNQMFGTKSQELTKLNT
jgi:lipoate-protein ligase B